MPVLCWKGGPAVSASSSPCCGGARRESARGPLRRVLHGAGWFLPSALLAVMPKCPVCLAAYVAMATGLGLSLPVAAALRTCLIVLCVGSLTWMICRRYLLPRLRAAREHAHES